MKAFASIAFGAVALAAASVGLATPAAARGDFGIHISPYGAGVSVDRYRNYCRDYSYRRRYSAYCRRYDGNYDYRYYNDDRYNDDRYRHDRYRHDRYSDDRYSDDRYDDDRYYDNDDGAYRHRRNRHDRDGWSGEGAHWNNERH